MTTVIKMLWSFFIFWGVADGAAFASDAREGCSRCHTTQLPIEEARFIEKEANYCVRCHGTKSEVNNGRSDSMPFVYHATSTDLAGGNFYYVALKGNRYGHNVAGFTDIGPDTISPPGLNNPSLAFHTTRLTCAGRYGCHGDRTRVSPYEAMKGVHHAYDPAKSSDGKTVATSYRFLLEVAGQEMNEEGYKWECNVNPGKHNGYQGADGWNDPKKHQLLLWPLSWKRCSWSQ